MCVPPYLYNIRHLVKSDKTAPINLLANTNFASTEHQLKLDISNLSYSTPLIS